MIMTRRRDFLRIAGGGRIKDWPTEDLYPKFAL